MNALPPRLRQFDNCLNSSLSELTASPVLSVIDSLFAAQDERNAVVFEMAARLRDPEPDLGAPMLNSIPGGL